MNNKYLGIDILSTLNDKWLFKKIIFIAQISYFTKLSSITQNLETPNRQVHSDS